jgi:hypothetical protein
MNSAFGARARGPAIPLTVLAVAATAVMLTACGGGGGGSGGGTTSSSTTKNVPSTISTSKTPSTPETPTTPAPVDPKFAAAPGSEPLPSLDAPQSGSTAAVSTGYEGIYVTKTGTPGQIALVGPDYRVTSRKGDFWFWAGLKVEGTGWTFTPESVGTDDGETLKDLTGSGTFFAKRSMFGSYKFDDGGSGVWGDLSYTYENALAVDQASMAGTWGSLDADGMKLTVDAAGAVSGSTAGGFGVCSLTGTVLQRESGTKKNMYSIQLTAANAATGDQKPCAMSAMPFKGAAVIGFSAAGKYDSNGYYRSLVGLLNTEGYARFGVSLVRQR